MMKRISTIEKGVQLIDLKKAKTQNANLTQVQIKKIIIQYAPLIKYIAQKIASRLPANIEIDDLVSSGVIGLMDAIEKYDPTRDNKFKTYAEFRIRGSILDELRAQDWVPRSVRDKAKSIDRTFTKLELKLGRAPSDQEMADEFEMSLDDFHSFNNNAKPVNLLSIDESFSYDESDKRSLLNVIDGTNGNDPQKKLTDKKLKKVLKKGIEQLPERQRLVLSLYYYEDLNLKEIGKILQVTESRISQLHAQGVNKLKIIMGEDNLSLLTLDPAV